jgi:hypothetical protein
MATTHDDLRVPKGPVTPKLFPGTTKNKLNTLLDGYIDRAAADPRVTGETDNAKHDPITKALALHFIFEDVYVRMSSEPLNVNIAEKGGHGYNTAQIDNMRALSQKYLDEAVGLATVITTATNIGLNTRVKNIFTF